MQVIKRNHPYNSEADLNQSSQRALSARYREEDNKLKEHIAIVKLRRLKRDQALLAIKKQINYQQDQLSQLQQRQNFYLNGKKWNIFVRVNKFPKDIKP